MSEPQSPAPNMRERARALFFLGFAASGVVAILVPAVRRFVPPCAFYSLTGLYCPGCGTARAMSALVRGDLLTALHMNALAVVAVVPVLGAVVRNALDAFGVHLWPRVRWHHALAWALVIAVIAFWLLRNLPFAPFTYLAPG